MISRVFFDHFMTFVSQLVGIGGHIARSIKTFEKGLHAIFPCSSSPPKIPASFVPSGSSIFSLGPTDIAKEPHLEAHPGRVRSSSGPSEKAKKAVLQSHSARKKRPLGGWRGRWWIGNQKRETPKCFPCSCKDTKLCGFLQMHVERY